MTRIKWIGHSTARRRQTPDGWLYQDVENQSLAVLASLHHVSLPILDEFIERMEKEAVGAGVELRQRRALLGVDLLRHLEWMQGRFIEIKRYEKLAAVLSLRNSANAKNKRPNARTVDHDEIEREFARLTLNGHTRREANGILFRRGLAARPTITGITKDLENNNCSFSRSELNKNVKLTTAR